MALQATGYKILLVDDDPLSVELLRDLLAWHGIAVVHAPAAEEGLALAARERPDLVMIDLSLPGMNGLDATRLLKQDPATRRVPVVMVSARAMKGDRQAALAQGCDAYLTKPLDTRTLAGEILALLRARGGPRRPSPAGHA